MGRNGKTPRGGAIALPRPTMQDVEYCESRSLAEAGAFYDAVYQIPTFFAVLQSVKEKSGQEAEFAVLTMLEVLNQTCLRENRGHGR